MKRSRSLTIIAALLLGSLPAHAREFTDDQGRTVEADLIAVQDDYVILSKNGRSARWPLSKLSKKDQAYAELWKKDPSSTPHYTVMLMERDGIGPEGVLNVRPSKDLGIPIVKVEEKATYKHYNIDLIPQGDGEGRNLTVAYTLYYVAPGGTVVPVSGTKPLELAVSGKPTRVQTKGLSILSTKETTTLPQFRTGPGGGVSTTSSTDRSKERFAGAWVRVYASDGSIAGEGKKLAYGIDRKETAWSGPNAQGDDIPLLEAFEKLSEFLDELPQLPELPELPDGLPDLPKPPEGLPGPPKPPTPGGPPKPPGLPKLPGS